MGSPACLSYLAVSIVYKKAFGCMKPCLQYFLNTQVLAANIIGTENIATSNEKKKLVTLLNFKSVNSLQNTDLWLYCV